MLELGSESQIIQYASGKLYRITQRQCGVLHLGLTIGPQPNPGTCFDTFVDPWWPQTQRQVGAQYGVRFHPMTGLFTYVDAIESVDVLIWVREGLG